MSRQSTYPMIEVKEALIQVLSNVTALPSITLPLLSPDLPGSTLSSDILAPSDFPPFPASFMDGYAVISPSPPGIYPITQRCTAGFQSTTPLLPGQVAYITTGSPLPPAADAVIMIEKTEAVQGESDKVRLLDSTAAGTNVRAIGSDVVKGQLLLPAGTVLKSAEIGLLASLSILEVAVHRRPKIGILSSGDELIDLSSSSSSSPPLGCIIDSNRVMLRHLLTEQTHCEVVDLGIVRDSLSALHSLLSPSLLSSLDALVTTGGVSMGELDLIKAFLSSSARVVFGRLNMKPGKPTTFALVERGSERPPLPVFALPGNPVSAFVCAHLVVAPAVWKMEGRKVREDGGWAKVRVKVVGQLRRDEERVEFHRAAIYWDSKRNELIALSTGSQQSSRLLSVARCNALLIIGPGGGKVQDGEMLEALLIAPLEPIEGKTLSAMVQTARHAHPMEGGHSCSHHHQKEAPSCSASAASQTPFEVRVAVITVSDRCAAGQAEDGSGPAIVQMLKDTKLVPSNFTFRIVHTRIVPDEAIPLSSLFLQLTDSPASLSPPLSSPPHLIFTTGGTGFSPRDITPDTLSPLLHRPAPGLVHLLLSSSLSSSPLGPLTLLSRPVAGMRGSTLCVTLPGSVNAVKENLNALLPVLPHAIQLMAGTQTPHTVQQTPKG